MRKMKKSKVIVMAAVAMALVSAHADVVTFGVNGSDTDWNTWVGGGTDETATDITANYTVGGVTFSLQMVGSSALRKFGGGDGSALVVIGGGNDSRLDEGTTSDTADDESITFKLSVSGTELESISLNSISMFYNNTDAGFDVVDGSANSASFSRDGGAQLQTYTAAQMTGLTPLSLSNVGGQGDNSWEMTVYAREGNMQFDDISINYTIPEPASLGLIVASGAGLFFVRRRLLL